MKPSIVTVDFHGEIETHLPHTNRNYATLCGLDGDDDGNGINQKILPTVGNKVTCDFCRQIFNVAQQFDAADFE